MKRQVVSILALALMTFCASISLAVDYPTNAWGYSSSDVNGLMQQRIDALREATDGTANSTSLTVNAVGDVVAGTNITAGAALIAGTTVTAGGAINGVPTGSGSVTSTISTTTSAAETYPQHHKTVITMDETELLISADAG